MNGNNRGLLTEVHFLGDQNRHHYSAPLLPSDSEEVWLAGKNKCAAAKKKKGCRHHFRLTYVAINAYDHSISGVVVTY